MKAIIRVLIVFLLFNALIIPAKLWAQQNVQLTLNLDKADRKVSPMLFGLMTEEINHSYDGGLYAELIRNRTFQDDNQKPVFWQLTDSTSKSAITLDRNEPLNKYLKVSLKFEANKDGTLPGLENLGYWGFPIRAATLYKGSFYAKSIKGGGALRIGLRAKDGKHYYAKTTVHSIGTDWQKYTFELKTAQDITRTAEAVFVITPSQPDTYWFNLVSVFPPTYNNRPNGNRPDIMQLLLEMKPTFLRLPGGNYLEGGNFANRFAWKHTIGPLENRKGHKGTWGYRASDGMGLLEYLEWCEDLHIEPVLAVFAGYTLGGDHLEGDLLTPFIKEALEEIEYVTGDIHTKWGAVRAKNGHPKPFPLHYVEIGNEDFFDRSGSYKQRFAQFYTAIKAKYPALQIISTFGKQFDIAGGTAEIEDEHYYRNAEQMEADATHYDNYDRNGTKVFVGEWATREGSPTTNFNAALGDAAWMTGMERNADIVIMSCYAPLFVNVNPGGMQWESDLIGYNTLNSYGSPSYYAQKMFNTYLGNRVVPIEAKGVPLKAQTLSKKDSIAGKTPNQIPAVFYVATKDTASGAVFLKLVNTIGKSQKVSIQLEGKAKINNTAKTVVLKANSPLDTNSIDDPLNIVPVEKEIKGIKKNFTYTMPPYSIQVVQIQTR
jgi:alpha-N-arabinofuranosidase